MRRTTSDPSGGAPRSALSERPRRAGRRWRTAAVAAVLLASSSGVRPTFAAQERNDPFMIVPADAAAAVALSPSQAEVDAAFAPQDVAVQTILQIARQVGVMLDADGSVRLWTDVVAGLFQLVRYPLAAAVLDARVIERADGGHELARMQAVLVVDTGGGHQPVENLIRHLLATYTNQDRTTLRTREGEAWVAGGVGYELRDDRLPGWATLTWGAVGNRYVIALGEGAVERLLACAADPGRSLSRTTWVTEAERTCRVTGTEFRLYADLDRLADGQPAGFRARLRTWLNLLDVPEARRAFVTVSRQGRVVESSAFVREGNADRLIRIADHAFLKTWGYDLIPSDATAFAVADVNFRRLPWNGWEAYVASRSPAAAAALRDALAGIEKRSGVSFRDDVLSRVGDRIVIHDFPVHALRLPVARTIYVPIEKDPEVVAEKLDRFMQALAAATGHPENPSPLRREPDGLWYWHFGLQGPAMKVCGDWIILSYSPFAVRENERRLTVYLNSARRSR
ncbi:MAG: hypothetical protein FLDDKLPJ_02288 [Phycisphaerae bacterium]|nr:hypothetical protein [Phycisphaerae bacterium]